MTYEPVQPPFTLSFGEMSKEELKRYFKWFIGMVPRRLNELAKAVQNTPGYGDWRPDRTPESLDLLGQWFSEQVGVRHRSEKEIRRLTDKVKFPVDVPNEELTARTFSLAVDIGMYLSQVFIQNTTKLRWRQPLNNQKFIDYGQPVLGEFKPGPFNPVRMVVTFAYGLVSHQRTADGLRAIYETWSKLAL